MIIKHIKMAAHWCRRNGLMFTLRYQRTLCFFNQKTCIRGQQLTFSAGLHQETQSSSRSASVSLKRASSQKAKEEEPVNPLEHPDYFGLRKLVTVKDMFLNRVHYGHHMGRRSEYMKPYIFGTRIDSDIIDLDKTLPLLQDALNFAAHIAYRGGIILFISRHKYTMPWVETTAQRCGEYAHCRYWQGGCFTDSMRTYGQVTRLPDLCILINTQNSVFNQHRAVVDSAKLLIPTIGVVDTDCDPRLITYPVPGNDDSSASIFYYLQLFETAILKGKAKKEEDLNSKR